ncbi:FAD/NAD(P)-binding domain-containing protein [Lophiostoma macrostomum CBS 122681]|uniref:FAD/NAD(P)-binding domain-containing protein n=1 Tax=Lophiostoma macrostomum CBS 122681 TaxID=1314788 RepID=A0A6A6T718_9PLEO|nr:FAD/NAD(P)-binding domain-containing protein [Lophiostoma macrostomum CBS 122681]
MPLKVLVVGAGIAGPAFATLLQHSDPQHTITVIERFPSLRTNGLQLDLEREGELVVRKMGLMSAMKDHSIPETGIQLVDSKGRALATMNLGEGAGGVLDITTECEIMRGDIVKVLYEAGLKYREKLNGQATGRKNEGGLSYEFGTTIAELEQNGDGVDVMFTGGKKERYDLVVAADGQGSRTRRLVFGAEQSDAAFKSLGWHTAIFTTPRVLGESGLAKASWAAKKRGFMLRNGDRPRTQVYLFNQGDGERLKKAHGGPLEKQKEAWAEAFKDIGWQQDRIVTGLKAADDFYAHEIGQVKMSQLHKNRVVLLGDAAYCPSVFTGQGTTTTLFGSYVLAGEIARHANNLPTALEEYERVVRPKVTQWQQVPSSINGWFPSSHFGVWVVNTLIWAAFKLKIDRLFSYFGSAGNQEKYAIPDYPELKLDDA